MADLTLAEYESLLRRSKLVSDDIVQQVVTGLRSKQGEDPDCNTLGRALIDAELISPWQHVARSSRWSAGWRRNTA